MSKYTDRKKGMPWYEIMGSDNKCALGYSFDDLIEAVTKAEKLKEQTNDTYYIWKIYMIRKV